MKIVNPLSVNKSEEPIQSVLRCLAGQGGCDGVPYDQMQAAADCIDAQQAEIDRLRAEVAKGQRAVCKVIKCCWDNKALCANDPKDCQFVIDAQEAVCKG